MPPLTLPVLARAAQTGRLPSLARIAVVEERWADLELLLASLASPDLPGPELVTTLTVVREGLAALPPDREKAVTLCRQLALDLLQQRAAHLAGQWPQWQRLAGELFADLGKRTAAGQSFQQAGDHVRAAEEYGAAGDLEQMEACYAQAEQARVRQRVDRDVSWQFQDLVAQGRRWESGGAG